MDASAQKIDFNHLTVENGLSQNSVLSFAQDGQGFIWIGTRYGLNRYDGTHIRVYKYNPASKTSISNNYILSLFCDSKKQLWVGTLNGLNIYNPISDDFIPIILKNATNNKDVRVMNCIYEDRKGNIWIGTNAGLWRKALADSVFINYFPVQTGSNFPGNVIHAIFEDESGLLWIGSDNGLTRMQPSNEGYSITTFRHEQNKNSVSSNLISSITEDRAHNIWTASIEGGINIFNREAHVFSTLTYLPATANGLIHKSVRKLLFDQKTGQVWAGTQEGISIIDPTTKKAVSYQHDPANQKTLTQNSVHSIFRDRQGIVWVGTYFGGVNIAYPSTTAFTTYQNTPSKTSISNNVVSCFAEDEKRNVWIGTEGGGLNYFNRATNSFSSFKNSPNDPNSLSSNLVKVVYKDKSDRIWIGTHGGYLDLLDPVTHSFRHFTQRFSDNPQSNSTAEIGTILEDSDGNLWTGSNAGLGILKNTNGQWDNIITKAPAALQPRDTLIKKLFEDAQKNIWIGTSGGLHFYNYETKKLENFFADGKEGSLKSDNVNCIQQDSHGNIWVGTYYGGLSVYNASSKKFKTFTEADGLPNNNIAGILEDNNGGLWISTSNGLSVMDTEKKKFRNYTADDGLSGNEFNYDAVFKNANGELFFGGFNGFSSFFPSSIETNNYKAPVVFTGLKLFNTPVNINGPDKLLQQNISTAPSISFQYNQGVFSIEYALLNFIKSNKNKYAYKLEGFDKQWNEVTTSAASYTNLPVGNYTFFVKGANNDGIWSETAAIKIHVLPPFWRTWWAYAVYALIIAAISFLVIRYFLLQALLKKEDELHQVKLNFFTNISHEIRTHLTLIMAPVDRLLEDKKEEGFSKQQLTAVKNNANRLLKLVSELMDFRKAETDHLQLQVGRFDLVLFLQDIYTSFRELSLSKNISISFIHNADEMFVWFDKEQLEKVFFNLLTNAFKFTPEGGRIVLNAEQKKAIIIVTVTDNGRGIAPKYMDKLFNNFFQVADHGMQNTGYGIGLALAKQIVTLHKGTITVKSEQATKQKEGYTSFAVTLLTGSRYFKNAGDIEKSSAPAAEINEPVPASASLPAGTDGKSGKENHPTILIAEDTAELRELIRSAFTGQYNMIECENGLYGWNTAIEQIPDLIISDVMMPEMDGFTFCEKIKTDQRTSHIPVILLTAKSAQVDQISGLETGADIYLTKPFSTKVLQLNVRNLLASREKMRIKFSQQINALPAIADDTAAKPVSVIVEDDYVNKLDKAFLEKVMMIIEENMDNPEFGVDMLARKTAMSLPVLYKKLKAVTNMSVNDFVKSVRMKKAAQLLLQKRMTVNEVCYAIGYNDRKYFSKEFKKQFGKTPSEYTGVTE